MENTKTEIAIGQAVWIQHNQGTYLGFEDGKHKVKITNKDEEIIKKVDSFLVDDEWEPPTYFKDWNKFYKYSGKKTCWSRNNGLMFFYYYQSTSVFKSEEIFAREEIIKKEVIDGSQFLDEDAIFHLLGEIEYEARPIEKQIEELEKQLREINKKKVPIYKQCFHVWSKDEEENTGGNSYQQLCTCEKCGKEEVNSYSKF